MKLLLVSDLHYALKQFDWVLSVAGGFDLVVLAGDHLDISGFVDMDAQIVVVLKYMRRLAERARLAVSSGNHDLNAEDARGERTARWMAKVRELGIPTDGDTVEAAGTLVTICPWWDGPHGRDAVGEQLAGAAGRRAGPWVWVYHAPPDQSPVSWTGTKHYGDAELRGWIGEYRPDIVLTGHIHQSPFRAGGCWVDRIGSAWVFNAGRQIGPCPTHVIVDTGAKTARWLSLAGNQVLRLDQPAARPVEDLSPL